MAVLRALLVSCHATRQAWLARLLDGPEVILDAAVLPAQVAGAVAHRSPDLIVIVVEADCDLPDLVQICGVLKGSPATVPLPLLALTRSAKHRLPAFEAGIDDVLTHQVRREEFLVRVRALVRASAARRQLAAEQLAEEVQHSEQIRAAFRRYISPNVADQILANPQLRDLTFAHTQRRAQAAVMFADMRGFTGLSERLNPAQVVELLNEFFALLTDITFQYDGTIFNMAGDSLLVGFGVPVEQSDLAQRAVLAARLMLEKFAALAAVWRARFGVETGLGIGINAGEVIAGNVGSPAYMSYTIIGDTVNVASRLGQRARAGEMLFSEAVKHVLDQHGFAIGALPLPALVLRGRSSPIDIFCVPCERRVDLRAH
jgi:adenylate cyclase